MNNEHNDPDQLNKITQLIKSAFFFWCEYSHCSHCAEKQSH
jgi:hypothetical protein